MEKQYEAIMKICDFACIFVCVCLDLCPSMHKKRVLTQPSREDCFTRALPAGGQLGTSTDLRQLWSRLTAGVDCIRLPPKGRPVAAPRETSPAYQTLGYSEAGVLHGKTGTSGEA